MNDNEIFKKFKNIRFESINDLTEEEFQLYYDYFYRKHYSLLRKYITLLNLEKIKKYGLLNVFYKEKSLQNDDSTLHPTKFHYSLSEQKISIEFYILMEVIIKKDLKTQGLFRKNTSYSLLKKSYDDLVKFISENKKPELIIAKMLEYDEITLCCLFKRLFDNYSTGPLPVVFFDSYIGLADVENHYERIICLKFLHLNVPRENRVFIEVMANFFEMLYRVSTSDGKDCKNHLDRYGLAVVMAPKFFKLADINFSLESIEKLSDLVTFVFKYIDSIFKISYI
ncbi:hypothetical protein DMUE_2154 [Dictyocoela muelleri]|nr:hypothetical protein DMUE_2154 [Dictyocoela muelleri]